MVVSIVNHTAMGLILYWSRGDYIVYHMVGIETHRV